MNTSERIVVGMVNRVAALRYAEGTLVSFLDALAITDPDLARVVAPQIERLLLAKRSLHESFWTDTPA